jgi:cytoskeletal protein RodZ
MSDKNKTIGNILKEARETKELSLEEIAALTKIRVKYLVAIEADQLDVLPSIVQIRGFVRSFANAVDLDPTLLLGQLRSSLSQDSIQEDKVVQELQDLEKPNEEQPLGEIGTVLKEQREKLGFSIAAVENQIFIPERYLTAIENGRLEDLPSTVQGKGMVKNYAQFLGLDPDPILLNYADILQERLKQSRVSEPEQTRPQTSKATIRRFLSSPTILWIGVVIIIGFVSIWSGWLIFGTRNTDTEVTATIPGVAEILLPSITFTPLPEALGATPGDIEVDITVTADFEGNETELPELTPTSSFTGNERVQVQLITTQRAWVRITVDNIIAFEGRLLPGSVKLFGGELNIEVLTGNAGGVEIIFNQRELGVMGLHGEVVSRIFTSEGIATPTPTISPTPTPSDTPEVTPTPTETAQPES